MSVAATARRADEVLTEIERIVVGKRSVEAHLDCGARRWARPARGSSRPRQDLDRTVVRDGSRSRLHTRAVHPGSAAGRLARLNGLRHVHRPVRVPTGPVFTNLLLADEINRTPPKTQAALLEAMAEGQVSVDGQTRPLPTPFMVLATDNRSSTGHLSPPEAQRDRFALRLRLGYLDEAGETEMLQRRLDRRSAPRNSPRLSTRPKPRPCAGRRTGRCPRRRGALCGRLGRRLPQPPAGGGRDQPAPSWTWCRWRARAMLAGRDYVIPEDVKHWRQPATAFTGSACVPKCGSARFTATT